MPIFVLYLGTDEEKIEECAEDPNNCVNTTFPFENFNTFKQFGEWAILNIKN